MSNNYAAFLATLSPDYDYPMDEASGDYLNDGGGGAMGLVPTGFPWRQAPGVIRNEPFEHGMWNGHPQSFCFANSLSTGAANYPDANGFTTGTMNVIVRQFGVNGGTSPEYWCPISFQYRSSATLTPANSARIEIDDSGFIYFMINVSQTGGLPALSLRIISDNSEITYGLPYMITVVQRGDATGVHILLNGVEIDTTISLGASADSDSWIQLLDDAGLTLGAPMFINGVASGNTGGFSAFDRGHGIVQRPALWRNTALSDAQIFALFQNAAFEVTPQDYYEYITDRFVETGQAFFGHMGWLQGTASASATGVQEIGPVQVTGDGHDDMDWNAPREESNTLETARITNYPNYKSRFQSAGGQYTTSLYATDLEGFGVGTVSVLYTMNTAMGTMDVDRRTLTAFGEGAQGDDENVTIHFGNTDLGMTVIVTIGEVTANGTTTGDFWRCVGLLPYFGIDLPEFHMITVTQDGNGVEVYLDDSSLNCFPSSGGSNFDKDSWWNSFISPANTSVTLGYPGNTAHVEDLDVHHFLLLAGTALNPAEVAELWNAVLGIFPVEELGAWANTLSTTGNGDEDNGPGPDWWWRMNAAESPIRDVGIAQNRSVSPINANSIATGGDPLFEVTGPLPEDLTNKAIYFDGAGDSFEIGVNGVTGELVDVGTGTIGCFFSRNAIEDENIIYSQANDAYTAYWTWGLNGDRVELIVQTSPGNKVTLTSSISITDNLFHILVLTCDGAVYRLYIDDGGEDTGATVEVEGTGAEGDWFDAFTADNSAIGARADSGFTTETTGRISEPFIYDGDVLSSTEIAVLAEAAIEDGITGSPATSGVVVFENVTFRNGANADIRVENGGVDFLQVLQVNRGKFLGGAQGSSIYQPQSVLLKGQVQAQFRGCESDLQDTPSFGRGGIVGTQIDPTAVTTADGSILVSDCDFEAMGFLDGTDFLSPVMCQAGFGMSVLDSRFTNCLGTGVGWRADAQRVSVVNNQIEGTTQALGAIHSAQGLNTRLGSGWTIRGNQAVDTDGNAYSIDGDNSDSTGAARNILIGGNASDECTVAYRITRIGDAILERNNADNCFEGMRIGACESSIAVRRNEVLNHTGTAYIAAEASLQLMDLSMDRNKADGGGVGDGITVTNVRNLTLTRSKLTNMDIGVQLGNIALEGIFGKNQVQATTPFAILSSTIQNGFAVGGNQIRDLGNLTEIVVSSTEIVVAANYHVLDATDPEDLATINGPLYDGFLLVLRLAAFSETITILDASSIGGDNLFLNGSADVVFGADNDQLWLIGQGGSWFEIQQQLF